MDKKIEDWIVQELRVGDKFYLKSQPGKKFSALGQKGKEMVCGDESDETVRFTVLVDSDDIYKQASDWEGVNPFLPNTIEFISYDLSNVLSMLGINRRRDDFADEVDKIGWSVKGQDFEVVKEVPRLGWDPYFIIDGERVPYQRGFVWDLFQKRALIDSIYKGLECGRIIVHYKSHNDQVALYRKGFTDCATFDIVDGKQRLSTIVSFCRNEFSDSQGNYYRELSKRAQQSFMNYRGLLFGKVENVTNKQICDIFLNNCSQGVPVATYHIDFINELSKTL